MPWLMRTGASVEECRYNIAEIIAYICRVVAESGGWLNYGRLSHTLLEANECHNLHTLMLLSGVRKGAFEGVLDGWSSLSEF